MARIAIIGAGPAGLASARWLKAHGFHPVLFEASDGIGGQWNRDNPNSGIWPQMRTNTFREATRFSDLDYPDGTPLFPHNRQVLAHLRAYAEAFGLTEGAHFNCRVTGLEQADGGYDLSYTEAGAARTERFAKVVVASGRYNCPRIPPVPGLESFSGALGVLHAFQYKDPEAFRGKHVVVAGGSISALEIASDLTMLGAASVRLAQRRQRYVLPKMVAGTPIEYFAFTYGGALDAETADPETAAAAMRDFALTYGGDPARYGAPAPHPDITRAGFTGSQHFLPLVCEGRITVTGWPTHVSGRAVHFADGSEAEADALIFGTGFDLHLPFLSDDLRNRLEVTRSGLTLSDFTFHPDLPGLGFAGLWAQNGPYLVPIEQQARYLALCWAGELPGQDLAAGIDACRRDGHHDGYREENEMAIRFARLCGTDPAALGDPDVMAHIRPMAVTSDLFRITGPDARDDGRDRVLRQHKRFVPERTAATTGD